VFWFSVQLLFEIFLILRRTERDIIKNVHWSSSNVTVILVRFEWSLTFFSTDFRKILEYQISWKSVQWEPNLLYADGQANMTKLSFFVNFTNAPTDLVHQFVATHTICSHTYCVRIAATLRDGRQKGRWSTPGYDRLYGRHNFQTGRGIRPPSCLMSKGTLSTGLKLPRHKADHSPSPTSQVTNAWSYISTPPYTFTT
jgi:hypothetical protein